MAAKKQAKKKKSDSELVSEMAVHIKKSSPELPYNGPVTVIVNEVVPEKITQKWLDENNYRIKYNPRYPGGFRLIEK